MIGKFGLAAAAAAFVLAGGTANAAKHYVSSKGEWTLNVKETKYPAGFPNFAYVNSQAPKGGELRLVSNLRLSTFDKYNPFTIKGSAPAYLSALMFDSLLAGAQDEVGAGYGLLAEDVEVSADGLTATFRLRKEARFHNGDPVLAQDVKHSFDMLLGPYTSPAYKTTLEDLAAQYGVSRERVRQIEVRAFEKLQKSMREAAIAKNMVEA